MRNFPKAKLQVVAVDRAVGLIDERIDVAVRVRAALGTDAALTMYLGTLQPNSHRRASSRPRPVPAATSGASDLPTLATTDQMGEIIWEFIGPEGEGSIRHQPRMTCVDFVALRACHRRLGHRVDAGSAIAAPKS